MNTHPDQIVQAEDGRITVYRQCRTCGKMFEVKRLDIARFCSDTCRVKAWKAREEV